MSVPRTRDPACDLAVQPTVSTLHIPAAHTFIPFQQFSISDGCGIRNPADDNNNKTSVPVVSVVTAVSGLCPAIPVVSMQQTAQLAQAVVTSTIIPVVTPMTVQPANCLTPTTTMTVANTLNIGSHISVPVQHHTVNIASINVSTQPVATVSTFTNSHHNTSPTALNKPTICSSTTTTNNSPPTNSTKPNGSNSSKPPSTQSSASEQNEDLVKPVFKDGELVLEVECGQNKAILYLSKLCQGSKGPCISFQSSWLTPNEFQFVSGRETAKDWKRSIRHHGKSLKLLLAKGILNVHPTMCDCDGCRQGATLTRKGEKRRIPNGDRRPRKAGSTSSSVGSDGNSSGAFRLLGSSTMAAHLTAPAATQAKPEVKRSGIDKSKMADTLASSTLTDNTTKVAAKPSAAPRPSSLNTSRDSVKPKPISCSLAVTSPLLAAVASASPTTPGQFHTAPTTPGQLNPTPTTPGHFIPAPGQPTPSRVQPYPSASMFSSSTTSPASTSLLVASLSTPLTAALSATVDPPMGYVTTNPEVSNTHSPSHPSSNQPCTQSSPDEDCDLSESADDDTEEHSKTDPEMFHPQSKTDPEMFHPQSKTDPEMFHPQSKTDPEMFHPQSKTAMCVYDNEDHAMSNDTDESQNMDDKSDMFDDDDDCVDESSNGSSFKDSENSNCSLNEQMNNGGSDHENSLGESLLVTEQQTDQVSAEASGQCSDVKKDFDLKESAELAATSEAPVTDAANEAKCNPAVSAQSALTASLAVSAVPGTYSQPLFVSVSSNNVKSEHIWVPPRLSPQSGPVQQNSTNAVKAADVLVSAERSGHLRPDDHTSYEQSQNIDKQNMPKKPETVSQSSEFQQSREFQVQQSKELAQAVKQETQVAGPTVTKEFQSIERHLTGHFDHDRSETKCETSYVRGTQEHSLGGGSEKSNRDKEREEKYKQKLKEERNRKEREERNKKDREREERRERERREEKDAERRRQEEKERREMAKAHTENNSKENTSIDHCRRPPGGVAEAAAFSDYMRVLAAGHAHPFMSPTLSYMSSLFPVRPQEANMQTHLLHPMSAFGSQLSGLSKDHMIYQTPGGMLSSFGPHPFTPLHPVLQRHPYTTQQSLLDYQRSLTTAAAYPWPAAYPYFIPNVTASSSQAVASSAAGMKRPTTEIEAAMEMNAKRMRYEGRPPEYTSTWDYFAAAAAATQHQRATAMAPSLPCGLESASMDKTAEYLRKRYMEYGPQATAYLSALPEYSRTPYHCACADHRDDNIVMWGVEDVCKFLGSLDGCAVYTDHFREQRVTGRILALLTPDHFVKAMGMKLGPAVLLSEAVAKKVQDSTKMYSCDACRSIALTQPAHPMALPL